VRFYAEQYQFYCGIDLHARQMYVCIVDNAGEIRVHRNMTASPALLEGTLRPFAGQDLVVAVECVLTWYWIANFCAERKIPFVLGHALDMKAIPADMRLLDVYHEILLELEAEMIRRARLDDPVGLQLLRSILQGSIRAGRTSRYPQWTE